MVDSLRVANVIEEGRWGGPQKRITAVAHALKSHNIHTEVFLPKRHSGKFCEFLKKSNITHYCLRFSRLSYQLFDLILYGLLFFPEILVLAKKLRDGKFDLVHVSGGSWQYKGAIAGKLAGIPVIWHLNDTQMPKIVVLIFRVFALITASGFIVTAERVRKAYLDGSKIASIGTSSIQAPVDTKTEFNAAKIKKNTKMNRYSSPRIVSIANVNPLKGLEYLIESAKILLDEGIDCMFFVIGPVYETQKRYFETLKNKVETCGISNHFIFMGNIDDVAPVLAASEVYVCSSIAESGPMTVWEAMSMERAVVSTDVGDVASYIRSGVNGYVVPVRDARQLAMRIRDLVLDESRRNLFGKKAREIAISQLDLEVIAEKTAKFYRTVYALKKNELSVTP